MPVSQPLGGRRLEIPEPAADAPTATARRRTWLIAAAPAALVTYPLIGLAFQFDERLQIYLRNRFTSANPVAVAADVADGIGHYLDIGNFRPVGRYIEYFVHGLIYETAEATALSPHVVLGMVRLVLTAVVAVLAVRVVEALMRSAGVSGRGSLLGLYPLALGAVLVANGTRGPLAYFPHTFLGCAALILAAALATARDRDLRSRPVGRREYLSMALLGAVMAVFYDVAYLGPPIAGGFVAARWAAAGLSARALVQTAAVRRWAALCVGFGAVFVPVRTEIARRCADGLCYAASDLSLSFDAVRAGLPRLLTGAPPVGWAHNAQLAADAEVALGLGSVGANALGAIALCGIAVYAVHALRGRFIIGVSAPDDDVPNSDVPVGKAAVGDVRISDVPGGDADGSDAPVGSSGAEEHIADAAADARGRRLMAALFGLAALIGVSAAALAGLSAWVQQRGHPIGRAWRETLLTQFAWSLVLAGCLVALDLAVRSERARRAAQSLVATAFGLPRAHARHAQLVRTARALVTAVLCAGLALTLVSNARFAEVLRHDPEASVISMISTSSTRFDFEPSGNRTRCLLIDAYTEHVSPESTSAGWIVRENLDGLMADRAGRMYCEPLSSR